MKRVFKPLSYALMVIVILFELATTSSIAATPEYGSLTRGDVAYWLFNTFLPDSVKTANFTDTHGKYYADAAEWAYISGLIYGIDEGIFAGDRAITRIELAAIFVRMVEAAYSSRYDLVCRDLNEYSDANMVPDWARQSISIALEYEIIEANGNRIDPLGYVDYCTVTNALNAVYAINNLNILTDSTSYRGAYFRNINNGSALHLGMHMDNVAGVAGFDVKNWSAAGNNDIRMNIMRSRVVSIYVSIVDWKWNDSVQVGMMKSEVEEILGEPKPPLEPYGIPRGLPFYYLLDSEGNVVESDSDASYSLEVSYDDSHQV